MILGASLLFYWFGGIFLVGLPLPLVLLLLVKELLDANKPQVSSAVLELSELGSDHILVETGPHYECGDVGIVLVPGYYGSGSRAPLHLS